MADRLAVTVTVPWCCVLIHPATLRQCVNAWVARPFLIRGRCL